MVAEVYRRPETAKDNRDIHRAGESDQAVQARVRVSRTAEYGGTAIEYGRIEIEYEGTAAEYGGTAAEYGGTAAEYGGTAAEYGGTK